MAKKLVSKRKLGRPAGRVQVTQMQMRATPEFLKAIDDWRNKQPDRPPRAVAIRRLIESALKA